MELLLNLLWLMLALPAFWLWQRQAERTRARQSWHSFRRLLVLGCLLILLFPVISASDDLHFIRPEMEESTSSKRALRHAASDKLSSFRIALPPLAATTQIAQIVPIAHDCGLVCIPGVCLSHRAPLQSDAQRGPPPVILA